MLKKWTLPQIQNGVQKGGEIHDKYGEFLGDILLAGGFMSDSEVNGFYGCSELSDPFLMTDMQKAVEVIDDAVDNGEKIVIYGDYDCDGVTAASMLYSYLEENGAEVEYYIPERSDGFGMNIPALEKLVENGAQLIVTVDNGISANKEAEFLKEKGVKLVITDHHSQTGEIPFCEACVNPNRSDDTSPFKELCGAGVVLKLLIAMCGNEDFVLDSYADLAAVGTVGDVMPLYGENRLIVKKGLKSIKEGQNFGLRALIDKAGANPNSLTAEDLAFKICPRINCAGRVSSATISAKLLLADSPERANTLAEELNELNSRRKTISDEIYADIENQIEQDPKIVYERVIVLAGEGWNVGMIGLVCAKVAEKYGKPAVVISIENGIARGSCRSVGNFSIHKMLMHCADVFDNYGGHPMAGGFSLSADKIETLKKKIYEFARENYPTMPDAELVFSRETRIDELNVNTVQLLENLAPFGEGNRKPLLLFKNCTVVDRKPMKDGKFVSFTARQGNASMRAFSFEISYDEFFIENNMTADIAAYAQINEFNGRKSVELHFIDFRPGGFDQNKFFAAKRAYEAIRRGEGCDERLYPRVVPQSREDLMKIYDMFVKFGGRYSLEQLAAFNKSVNYCMMMIASDAFVEAGMFEKEGERLKKVSVNGKRDLFKEGFLSRIQLRDGKVLAV